MHNRRTSGHRPQRLWVALLAAAFVTPLLACGPTIFADNTALSVIGDPPPPPPKPEPVVETPKRVEVTNNAVTISDTIEFEINKAVIREVSFSLLTEVAEAITSHPHIKKLSVEGHASADGDDRHNMKLSERRAKAVMEYLVKKGGLAEAMLTSKGWGETRPLDSSDPESAVNRRVEFIIVEQDVTETKVEIDPETGEKTVLEEKTSRVEK